MIFPANKNPVTLWFYFWKMRPVVPCILLVTYYLSRKDVNMILDEFVVG